MPTKRTSWFSNPKTISSDINHIIFNSSPKTGDSTKKSWWQRFCAGGYRQITEIPRKTYVSDAMSKDLKKRKFKLIGSTIGYAFMLAVGMSDDHMVNCFRH
ncbi:DNA-3-methyladenine glycosylase I [Aphanothece hegewaldii]|uniref:DNA-3-methyladenine glycosylase I n=1 Tax=Aphanothece hegewaldii TaxID=1521625 RepID=UPI003CCC24F0